MSWFLLVCLFFFFQAEDGIRDLVRSRGLGDVYKRQLLVIGIFPMLTNEFYNLLLYRHILTILHKDSFAHLITVVQIVRTLSR